MLKLRVEESPMETALLLSLSIKFGLKKLKMFILNSLLLKAPLESLEGELLDQSY